MNRPRDANFRLPRRMILRGRTPFRLLFEEGRTLRAGRIVIRYRVLPPESDDPDHDLLTAFIVGKRHGRAVDRNRARRLMRENWRLMRPGFLRGLEEAGFRGRLEIGLIWSGPHAARQKPRFDDVAADLERGLDRLVAAVSEPAGHRKPDE